MFGSRFTLVGDEVVRLVPDERPAERAAHLGVRVRQHALGEGIRRVELVVSEEAVKAAVVVVGARARDRLHLNADGAAHRDVEQVRHDLEFGDGVAADAGLAEDPEQHMFCVICCPSRLSWNAESRVTPG